MKSVKGFYTFENKDSHEDLPAFLSSMDIVLGETAGEAPGSGDRAHH